MLKTDDEYESGIHQFKFAQTNVAFKYIGEDPVGLVRLWPYQ